MTMFSFISYQFVKQNKIKTMKNVSKIFEINEKVRFLKDYIWKYRNRNIGIQFSQINRH